MAAHAEKQASLRAYIPARGRRRAYLDHLDELAAELGAELVLIWPGRRGWDGRAFAALGWAGQAVLDADPPQAWVPLPLTRWHYLVGLHELGHIACGPEPGASERAMEEHVWDWAFGRSQTTVSPADITRVVESLARYDSGSPVSAEPTSTGSVWNISTNTCGGNPGAFQRSGDSRT